MKELTATMGSGRGREDGRNERTLSTRELTDITESLRWKADQDLDAAKRLKGAGGVVEQRWKSLERTLREQAKRKHERNWNRKTPR